MKKLTGLFTSLFIFAAIPNIAQATLYDIVAVLSGSNGFGASGFHDANDSTPMSGSALVYTMAQDYLVNIIQTLAPFQQHLEYLQLRGLTYPCQVT